MATKKISGYIKLHRTKIPNKKTQSIRPLIKPVIKSKVKKNTKMQNKNTE